VLTQPKRVALLAYLAVATPHRFHRRDTLLGLLWPELDQDHARAALRQALHGLRQALGPAVLPGRGDEEVSLDPAALWCDAHAFDESVATGDAEKALALYRGDFLEGFYLSGTEDFERWVEEQRIRLRQAAARAAGVLLERYETAGDMATAVQWARRAAGLMPFDEGMVQRLIALLDRSGDRAGAVQAYEQFAARIAGELEVKPAPETTALIGTVRARDAGRTTPQRLPIALADSSEIPATRGVPVSPRPRAGTPGVRRVAWSSAVIAVAVALVAGRLYVRSNRGPQLRADRVVVATFANRTNDTTLDRLGELAADWITRGLSETGLVEVADPGAKPPPGGGAAPNEAEAAHRLALATGSEVAVWGTFFRSGDSLEFAAQITDERQRELVRSLGPVLGASDDPRPAIATLRQRIIASLAVVLDPRLRDWQGRTSQPPSYAAYRAFAAGVDAMNRFNTSEAVRLLYRAAALDSTYTLPLVWAAFAHWWRFECDKTERLEKKLGAVPERLARVDRLMLNRWVAQCHGDLPAVYQNSRLLVEALPGSELMAGYLGRDALLIDRPREAITILRRLHPDLGALRDWPYFYWLTAAYHSLGQHEQELEAARLARRLNPGNLSSLRQEALALAALGRVREVNELLDELPAQRPHPWRTPAAVIRETALELWAHGYRAASDSVLDRALAWLDGRPVKERGSEGARRLRLQTLYVARRWEPAQVLAEELTREHPDSLTYQGVWGALAAQRGDQAEAAHADSVLAAHSRPFFQGLPAYWRACIAAQLGDRPRAVRLIAQAHQEGLWLTGEFWEQPIATLHADPCFEPLHHYPPFEQLLRPKG